jgi:uncharacterized protein YfaP (DUF2135 family)
MTVMNPIVSHVLPTFALLTGLLGCESSTFCACFDGKACTQWQPAQKMFAGKDINSLQTADLDGDGKPEIVTAGADGVDVLRNQGDGTFAKAVVYPQEGSPVDIVAADLNGDSKLDLVVTNFEAPKARVLLNNGDGTLVPGADIVLDADSDSYPSALVAADLNGDGHPDLAFTVVRQLNTTTVDVVFSQGDGTFTAPVSYPVGVASYQLITADLDGDGKPDLAAAIDFDSEVMVLRNQGDGSFAAPLSYATGSRPIATAAADLNADGLTDLVFNTLDDGASVLLQQESGFATAVNYRPGPLSFSVAVADLNGDGEPDLVGPRYGREQNILTVLYGQGKGTFGTAHYLTLADEAATVAAADLNGDGAPDLVVSSLDGTLSVLLHCAE